MSTAGENGIIRVAIADDHVMLRRSLVAFLNSTDGIRVVCEGANGQQLLEAIEASDEKPHICILDVLMPVMNGYDTLIALKKVLPETKVLILTMMDHGSNVIRMLGAGADGYILKGEEIEELISAIRFLAQYGYYYNPEMAKSQKFLLGKAAKSGDWTFNDKERQFLELCASEMPYKEIASAMNVSVKTVEGYRSALFTRLNVKSRTGLALYALQTGIARFEKGGDK